MMMAIRTGPTGPANAAHSGQAFMVSLEPAISGTAVAEIVIGAPIGLSGIFDADDSRKNSQNE